MEILAGITGYIMYPLMALAVWPVIASMIHRILKEKQIVPHLFFLSAFTLASAYMLYFAFSAALGPKW